MVHVWMVKTDRVLSEEEAAALTACLMYHTQNLVSIIIFIQF